MTKLPSLNAPQPGNAPSVRVIATICHLRFYCERGRGAAKAPPSTRRRGSRVPPDRSPDGAQRNPGSRVQFLSKHLFRNEKKRGGEETAMPQRDCRLWGSTSLEECPA